ncbi:hypothetical protein HZA44_00885, partial [Candidatus Peregrinibacteria bacterium]|nr:hypothetical protein [Candidatus Peregrinibacteria bacterium]
MQKPLVTIGLVLFKAEHYLKLCLGSLLAQDYPNVEILIRDQSPNGEAYDYIVSALKIVLRTRDLKRFRINRQAAQKALRIAPDRRAELVQKITQVLKGAKFVTQAYNSSSHPAEFLSSQAVGFDALVEFGSKRVAPYSDKTILDELQRHGLYRKHARYASGAPIQLAVISALRAGATDGLVCDLGSKLTRLG